MPMFDTSNGCVGLSSTETLYSQVQKIYLKSKRGEEKTKNLRVTIDLKAGLAVSPGKVLNVQITDDNDSTFFYSLVLTQDDFRILKAQQGLLVDFDHFPSQLVKLLQVCKSEDTPKFILVLDEEDLEIPNGFASCSNQTLPINGVHFKVIETNNFKNLCHLSLKVAQGSDSDIKNHMSQKITNLTEKLVEQLRRAETAEKNLTEALKALESKNKELSDIQLKLAEERSSLRIETSHQISEEREKLNRLQMEWQKKLDNEKQLLENQHQKTINEMNEQINLLTFNNKNLYEAKCQFETSVKEKNYQIEVLDKQITQLTQELSSLRKQNSQLDQDYHEKDKVVVGLKTKLSVLEQEVKDKSKLLDKQQELLRIANEQKSFLEEALNERESHLQRKQVTIQNLSTDLMKSNEIITKLQTDLAASKAKMKLRTDIAFEQERILEKKTQEISIQAELLKQLEEKVEKLSKDLGHTKSSLEEADKKLEEKEITIKKNENVISWLNRRLTESTTPISTSSATKVTDSLTTQTKGHYSTLTKGWPPWLVNSVVGDGGQIPAFRKDGGANFTDQPLASQPNTNTISTNSSITRPSSTSTPVEIGFDQPRNRILKIDENIHPPERKTGEDQTEKSRVLDPRYFQTCVDLPGKAQVSKGNNVKVDYSSSGSAKSTARSTNSRPLTSAYFPRKTVPS